jgi:hypothetical protein
MKKIFSVLCDLAGIALLGKSYLAENYTKKELAEMGVTLN